MSFLKHTAAALAAALWINGAVAEVGTYRDGTINQLPSKADARIVISDQTYDVAKNVVVRRSATATIPLQLLRVGQKIQFAVAGEGPGVRGTVTEIVVPK